MSNINYEEIKKFADKNRSTKWSAEISLQPAGVEKLSIAPEDFVEFEIHGLRDNLKLNMDVLTHVVKDVVAVLAEQKPLVFYIAAMEESLVITSVTQKPSGGPKLTHNFEIEFVGDWNWRFTFAKLLADVLPNQFCNLRKIYLVFGFNCDNCVKQIFEKMNWTFPETHKDAEEVLRTVKVDDLFFDSYAGTRTKYNEFTLGATNTQIRYFFHQRMGPKKKC